MWVANEGTSPHLTPQLRHLQGWGQGRWEFLPFRIAVYLCKTQGK